MKKTSQWESLMFRPQLPEHWSFQEQIDKCDESYISFIRYAYLHHKSTDFDKIYVIFCEFAPGKYPYRYIVRGGKNCQPNESINRFTSLKAAKNHLIRLMQSTNKWIENIHTPKAIAEYEDNISRSLLLEEYKSTNI